MSAGNAEMDENTELFLVEVCFTLFNSFRMEKDPLTYLKVYVLPP
jgi:hypothetical protein